MTWILTIPHESQWCGAQQPKQPMAK